MLLTERFAPLMAQALHCAESAEGLALSLDEIQKRLLSLAEEERSQIWEGKSILHDDSAKNDLDDARFAVYAWVDEKMLNAQRADASAWMPLSLQCHYFSTTEAGQQFFARLTVLLDRLCLAREDAENTLDLAMRLELAQNLAKEQDGMELLRVFALCLLYGFRGRLFGQEELLQRVRKACLPLVRSRKSPPPSSLWLTSPNEQALPTIWNAPPTCLCLSSAVPSSGSIVPIFSHIFLAKDCKLYEGFAETL